MSYFSMELQIFRNCDGCNEPGVLSERISLLSLAFA